MSTKEKLMVIFFIVLNIPVILLLHLSYICWLLTNIIPMFVMHWDDIEVIPEIIVQFYHKMVIDIIFNRD